MHPEQEKLKAILADFSPSFITGLRQQSQHPFLVENVEPPASEAQIRQLEDLLGVPLPKSYRQFLRQTAGFWLCGHTQLGINKTFIHNFLPFDQLNQQQQDRIKQQNSPWPPPSHGMVCFADCFILADGNQLLFDVSKGLQNGEYPIVYYDHAASPAQTIHLTNSFQDLINRFWELIVELRQID